MAVALFKFLPLLRRTKEGGSRLCLLSLKSAFGLSQGSGKLLQLYRGGRFKQLI